MLSVRAYWPEVYFSLDFYSLIILRCHEHQPICI